MSDIFSEGRPDIIHLSMLPSKCSDKKTTKNGVARSFIPCTYPLAGCRMALERKMINHQHMREHTKHQHEQLKKVNGCPCIFYSLSFIFWTPLRGWLLRPRGVHSGFDLVLYLDPLFQFSVFALQIGVELCFSAAKLPVARAQPLIPIYLILIPYCIE